MNYTATVLLFIGMWVLAAEGVSGAPLTVLTWALIIFAVRERLRLERASQATFVRPSERYDMPSSVSTEASWRGYGSSREPFAE